MNGWRPVLEGELAERAWETVNEISQALATAAAEMPPSNPTAETNEQVAPEAPPATSPVTEMDDQAASRNALLETHPSVAGGLAGRALFFAYRSRTGSERAEHGEIASALLERATESLATTPLLPDLYGGFSGIAWAAEHLYHPRFQDDAEPASPETPATPETPEDDDDDPLVEIDEALIRYLEHTPWAADYDLIRGLTGLGVYAVERMPRASALTCLSKVLDRLEETAERGPQGITWHTAPELLPDWQRETFPGGYYNLGVAHGVPGTIAMLGATTAAARALAGTAAAAAGVGETAGRVAARAHELAQGAVRWLMAQRLSGDEGSWFGSSFSPEVKATKSRLAWCYGDPGIAAALLLAGRACHEPAWEAFAIELGLSCTAREGAAGMIRDAGLCHGSAGLGHLFNRLYQETGKAPFAAASRQWFEAALDFRQPGLGIAGYRAYAVADDMVTQTWRPDAGFLEGASGIGLALLGGLSTFEPAWDRILALSTPGVSGGA